MVKPRSTESELAVTIPVIRRDLCLVNLKKKTHKASQSSYYGKKDAFLI